jgi:hypothetical protein
MYTLKKFNGEFKQVQKCKCKSHMLRQYLAHIQILIAC